MSQNGVHGEHEVFVAEGGKSSPSTSQISPRGAPHIGRSTRRSRRRNAGAPHCSGMNCDATTAAPQNNSPGATPSI